MRSVHNQSLEQDSGNLLFDSDALRFTEEKEHDARKVVGVTRRKSKLVCDRIQAGVAPSVIKIHQFLDHVHLRSPRQRNLRALASASMRPNIQYEGSHLRRIDLRAAFLAQKRQQTAQKASPLSITQKGVQVDSKQFDWS
jgi:hypothetical protein